MIIRSNNQLEELKNEIINQLKNDYNQKLNDQKQE